MYLSNRELRIWNEVTTSQERSCQNRSLVKIHQITWDVIRKASNCMAKLRNHQKQSTAFLAEHARVYHLMSLAEPVQHTQDIPGHLPLSWQVEMGPTGLEHPTHGVSVGKRTGAFRWPLQDGISGFLNVGKRHQLSSIVHCCGWEYPVHEATVILLTLDILRHKVTFSIAKGKVNMIIWLVVLIILKHIIQ